MTRTVAPTGTRAWSKSEASCWNRDAPPALGRHRRTSARAAAGGRRGAPGDTVRRGRAPPRAARRATVGWRGGGPRTHRPVQQGHEDELPFLPEALLESGDQVPGGLGRDHDRGLLLVTHRSEPTEAPFERLPARLRVCRVPRSRRCRRAGRGPSPGPVHVRLRTPLGFFCREIGHDDAIPRAAMKVYVKDS